MTDAPLDGPVHTVSFVAPDLVGALRTRYAPVATARGGELPHFSDIIFALDAAGRVVPRPERFRGWWPAWDEGFGDLRGTPDESSRRTLAWRSGHEAVFVDLHHRDGDVVEVAPRQVVRRLTERLAASGVTVRIGFELEFVLDNRSPTDERAATAYGFELPASHEACLTEVVDALSRSDIPVASWYAEAAPQQYEIALAHADPLAASDGATLARAAIRGVAHRHGLEADFRPKIRLEFGSGMHAHLSFHEGGANLLSRTDGGFPPPGRQLLAGVVSNLRAATALLVPSVEGYRRLIPYSAAGTTATWASDNRSAGVRHLNRGGASRAEVRVASSDANPYVVVAALLASALHGLEQEPDLPAMGAGDLYASTSASAQLLLPTDLLSAANLLAASAPLRRHLGDPMIEHLVALQRWAASSTSSDAPPA